MRLTDTHYRKENRGEMFRRLVDAGLIVNQYVEVNDDDMAISMHLLHEQFDELDDLIERAGYTVRARKYGPILKYVFLDWNV